MRPGLYIYLPAEMDPPAAFTVTLRTAGDPAALVQDLSRALAAADHRLAPHHPVTFDELRAVPLFPARVLTGATIAFGIIAFVLTAVGLYGVIATTVSQRTREIGIRMALGARLVSVMGDVLRGAFVLAGVGAMIGLLAGWAIAGQLGSWLYGVGRFDPTVYFAVFVLTLVGALVASAVPVRRAARIDPVQALRQ